MFTLILFVILGIMFGYFATQNTQTITITLANYATSIPLYIAIGITLLLGLSFSWLISLLNSFSFAMKMRGKNSTIKDSKRTISDLTKHVNELEIENAKLKGETKNL
jgi:uncharacterized integral membrane protein